LAPASTSLPGPVLARPAVPVEVLMTPESVAKSPPAPAATSTVRVAPERSMLFWNSTSLFAVAEPNLSVPQMPLLAAAVPQTCAVAALLPTFTVSLPPLAEKPPPSALCHWKLIPLAVVLLVRMKLPLDSNTPPFNWI